MWRSFLLTFFVIGLVGTLVLAWNSGRETQAEPNTKKTQQTSSASSTSNQPDHKNNSCVNCNFVSP